MKKRPKVSDTEKISIAFRVLADKEHVAEVARGFRVSNTRVNSLVKMVREDIDIFQKMKQKHDESQNREAIIR